MHEVIITTPVVLMHKSFFFKKKIAQQVLDESQNKLQKHSQKGQLAASEM